MTDSQPQQPQPQAQPQQPQGVPGVGFLVVAFLDEQAADQALDAMKNAKKQKQFYFEDAAVVRQDAQGKVHYHETGDMSASKGASIGALVGGVLGILAGPGGVVVGAGAGAALGGALAAGDKGFRNESLGTIGVALKPGTSAVAMITSHDFLRAVQQQVPIENIRTIVANLAAEISARFAENKNVAVGVLLTPDGLALKEVAANEASVEMVGAVITDDAVVAGAAVVTADGAAYKVVGATAEGAVGEAGIITDQGAVVVDAAAVADDAPETPAAAQS